MLGTNWPADMYFSAFNPTAVRAAHAAHARPLCPVAIKPEHYVSEVEEGASDLGARWREVRRALAASVDKNIHVGSRTLFRGYTCAPANGMRDMAFRRRR